ncbi:hypothetical protein I79_016919 [Cricetulus griseus]|uniref:Uncharacterized protein n=1 Tax=Cricetulus griseus TaxID=10029 RepID=G3I0N1_CRIGR|nr:hypothetical protein I79_016919 [Cricetulus griseus]
MLASAFLPPAFAWGTQGITPRVPPHPGFSGHVSIAYGGAPPPPPSQVPLLCF